MLVSLGAFNHYKSFCNTLFPISLAGILDHEIYLITKIHKKLLDGNLKNGAKLFIFNCIGYYNGITEK